MALPDLKLRVSPEEISPLAQRLKDLDYTEGAIADLLGIWDLSLLDAGELPRYLWQCRQHDSDLSHLTQLFLLGEGLSRKRVSDLLGRDAVSALMLCGVLFRRSGDLFSRVVLYPCLGHFLFTDYWVTQGQDPGQVYELGTDSFVLARVTPRHRVRRALDLCTGSGIHAILSASVCEHSSAVDINPRALEYTKLNAALNGVHCSTHLGDLYQALEEGETYDLITANPPYVPSPDEAVLVHRSAGETGEEVPERLVAGLPSRLSSGGLFSMVLEYPVLQHEDYLDRLERWLGEDQGWGIIVLSFGEKSVGAYIKLHVGPADDYHDKFSSYLDSYTKQGIVSVDFANVYITRGEPGAPNWKLKKTTYWPNGSRAQHIHEWLQVQSHYRSSSWRPDPNWKPKLSPYYKTLWRDREFTAGFLEAVDKKWMPPDPLNADEAELLFDMRGEQTVTELLAAWLAKGRDEESFRQAFRGLGLQMAVN
jgi:carbamoyltransferase